MRLLWECHNQSQDATSRHCVTGPDLPFFHKRKGVLKIDRSEKKYRDIGFVWELQAPAHRLLTASIGVTTVSIVSFCHQPFTFYRSCRSTYRAILVIASCNASLWSATSCMYFSWVSCGCCVDKCSPRLIFCSFRLHNCTVRNILKPSTSR